MVLVYFSKHAPSFNVNSFYYEFQTFLNLLCLILSSFFNFFPFFFLNIQTVSVYVLSTMSTCVALFRGQNVSVWDYMFQLDGS